MIGYSFLLAILVGILGYLLITRTDFNINILRTPGMLFQEQPGNMISNLYDLDIINKTFHEAQIDIKLKNLNGQIKVIGSNLLMKPQDNLEAKFLLLLPRSELKSMNTPVIIDVYSNGKLLQEVKTSFLGPMNEKENS